MSTARSAAPRPPTASAAPIPGGRWRRWLHLNFRIARLAVQRRWLGRDGFAASYDRLAPHYEHDWQCRLWPVTKSVLDRLPDPPPGPLLDLGCGSGSATAWLADRHPERDITGVDLSGGMLAEAAKRLGATPGLDSAAISWVRADMLDHLRSLPDASLALVFSGWAIGYSQPRQVIAETARALVPGGTWAFVVNQADTLAPVFRAFRETMQRFPRSVSRAALLRFPTNRAPIDRAMQQAGLEITWRDDGRHPIGKPPGPTGAPMLPWLLRTGVLAGFDEMLPLAQPGPLADFFEQRLQQHVTTQPLAHHFIAATATKEPRSADFSP